MKVSELTDAQLDFWVGSTLKVPGVRLEGSNKCTFINSQLSIQVRELFCPSTDWAFGGRVIETQRISLFPPAKSGESGDRKNWSASLNLIPGAEAKKLYGETPLIAAMRACVAAHHGDEVADLT
ncbi:phage protein NinX family protein [Burkholderia semiarida]|uniref:phage protein NinX family protein n=1 Tax=Burkholderia semiarida TaxID=2843303 RepID=UPI003878356B